MRPSILLPAPVNGTAVGAVELPETGALLVSGMTVSAGAEQDVVGADVRVTNWLVEVVGGHNSQAIVDPVVVAAAPQVYAWRAAGADVSFKLTAGDDSIPAYRTTRWQLAGRRLWE